MTVHFMPLILSAEAEQLTISYKNINNNNIA